MAISAVDFGCPQAGMQVSKALMQACNNDAPTSCWQHVGVEKCQLAGFTKLWDNLVSSQRPQPAVASRLSSMPSCRLLLFALGGQHERYAVLIDHVNVPKEIREGEREGETVHRPLGPCKLCICQAAQNEHRSTYLFLRRGREGR